MHLHTYFQQDLASLDGLISSCYFTRGDICTPPSRNFALLKAFTKIDIRLGQNMIKPVTQEVSRIEKQRGGFLDQKLKKQIDEFENTVYNDDRLWRS